MGTCKSCGKPTLPTYEYCLNCKPPVGNPSRRPEQRPPGPGPRQTGIPKEYMFADSFYSADGFLRREVCIEAAAGMADQFTNAEMTQTSFRHLFNQLKAIEQRIRFQPELGLGFVREHFGKFITQVEYQVGRGVVKSVFKDFVDAHRELAMSSVKEFRGFVDFVSAIYARMPRERR